MTNYIRARHIDSKVMATLTETFGVADAKGREMGYRVTIERQTYEADPDSHTLVRPAMIGTTYEVRPRALRDGKSFGALPVRSYRRVASLTEAANVAGVMIHKAQLRATKQ